MRIGIVGAGFAGLATAKVLTQAGHDVVVWDRSPDVGGVWSASRRYPGVQTQSPRDQYSLSDFPMPKSYPEWPTGEQVQRYLADYATHFGLDPLLHLQTEVTSVEAIAGGWRIVTRSHGTDEQETEVHRLVVANGVFCEPLVPQFPGVEDFATAGGRLCAATQFLDVEDARGKDVVVVGYGKSACDVAVAISDVAASTSVIARQLLWKVPKKVGGVVNFKYLLLTRMGEALFRYRTLRGAEKFLHGPGNRMRRAMLNSVGTASVRQYKLKKLGLVPRGTMEGIVRGAIGLVTDGFFDRVGDGRIAVHRDRTVARMLEKDQRPHVELDDGTVLPADLVVCATGFTQGTPFLAPDVTARVLDGRGNFALYRQILPPDVDNLYFAGYNSSFFSPLNAEVAALWIAAHLAGGLDLPDAATMRHAAAEQIAFMDDAVAGHHNRGTKIIPFSLHNADEVLADLGRNLPARTRAGHWLNPVTPSSYRKLTRAMIEQSSTTAQHAGTDPTDTRKVRPA
ncbi:flavin-containing monooxygenase [uncultured Jatrophihabitans sp.]|uniref:flavin-containing monooxygenase n=1 Tax=uncultured Jatrophihabitans sp. TaxID=1610747 RepID=UPI0035CB7834